jgi:hypothetical protein
MLTGHHGRLVATTDVSVLVDDEEVPGCDDAIVLVRMPLGKILRSVVWRIDAGGSSGCSLGVWPGLHQLPRIFSRAFFQFDPI